MPLSLPNDGPSDVDLVAAYDTRSQPFNRTATDDDILAKLARVCNVISGTLH
jgi:hypothetical protein